MPLQIGVQCTEEAVHAGRATAVHQEDANEHLLALQGAGPGWLSIWNEEPPSQG